MKAITKSHSVFRPQTVAEAVTAALREQILNGAIQEGEQLRQDAVAASLNVSRIPVREALRQLEAEGLATFYPHRGAVVSALSLDEIRELFELRAMLEVDALHRAIPHQTEEHISRAEEILDLFEDAFERGDVSVWGELNWRFHATLYEPSERSRTMAIIQKLHVNVERYIRVQLSLTHKIPQAQEDHRELLELCRARDVEAACRLLKPHILTAGEGLIAFLIEHRKSG